ncbi:membrane associated [Cryptosporidium sp. chipmunk genotype I]|uniref:membrane associated n=1 Tax=Cryptosporidium sp. chipmunk genotype I TaxID=1280935 RepID=UPI00351A29B2|nr:membrane associated [Cryptosporidium sp. chipmunk genotype I]
MFTYSVLGFSYRAEETPFTKKLKYALAFILVLQFIIVLMRVVTFTDVISTFFEAWMIYLGYVVYTEKSPCAFFLYITISFVRGVLLLLIAFEWIKRNTFIFSESKLVDRLRVVITIATPILSLLACIVSYNIFKNIHFVEETDELLNQFINPWNGSNTGALAAENAENGANDAGNPGRTNVNINSTSMHSPIMYTPFTGKSYKLSDISSSSNSMAGQACNYPIYKGT